MTRSLEFDAFIYNTAHGFKFEFKPLDKIRKHLYEREEFHIAKLNYTTLFFQYENKEFVLYMGLDSRRS